MGHFVPQEKLTVVTSHLLLYCSSKGGFSYRDIVSAFSNDLFIFNLLMILVWAVLFILCIGSPS